MKDKLIKSNNYINQQLIFSFMLICSVKEEESSQALSTQSKVLIGSAFLVVSLFLIILILGYFHDDPPGADDNIFNIHSTGNIPDMDDIIPDMDDIIPNTDNIQTDWEFDDGAGVFPRNRFNTDNIDIDVIETTENVNSALEALSNINI